MARPRPSTGHAVTAPHRAYEPPVALRTWVQSCAYVCTRQFPCAQEESAAIRPTEPPRAHTPPSGDWPGGPLSCRFESCRVPNKGKAGGTGKRGLRLSDGLPQRSRGALLALACIAELEAKPPVVCLV